MAAEISALSLAEAHQVLQEISGLSDSLARLVHGKVLPESLYAVGLSPLAEGRMAALRRSISSAVFDRGPSITRAAPELELALVSLADVKPKDRQLTFWKEVMRLRDLFKFEFFYSRKEQFSDEIEGDLEHLSKPALKVSRRARQGGRTERRLDQLSGLGVGGCLSAC